MSNSMNPKRLFDKLRELFGPLSQQQVDAINASLTDATGLQPSGACIRLVKQFEGLRLNAYKCPADIPTIGYGSTKGVKMGMTITAAEAEDFLREDLEEAAVAVRKLLGDAPTTQGQFDALVSFTYNLGMGSLSTSTLLRKHKARDFTGAAAEFSKWVYGGGRVLPGLVTRRAAERKLYEAKS